MRTRLRSHRREQNSGLRSLPALAGRASRTPRRHCRNVRRAVDRPAIVRSRSRKSFRRGDRGGCRVCYRSQSQRLNFSRRFAAAVRWRSAGWAAVCGTGTAGSLPLWLSLLWERREADVFAVNRLARNGTFAEAVVWHTDCLIQMFECEHRIPRSHVRQNVGLRRFAHVLANVATG